MRKRNLFVTGMLFFVLPGTGQAVELIGNKLELYGKAHVSLDYSDPDATGEDSQLNVSNNSTRIGFKGEHAINSGMTLMWQYEQNVDIAESGGEFGSRNSFLGMKGDFGEVLAGHYDTPSKSLGSAWAMFSDTIGDRRAILGSYSDGNGPDNDDYGNVLNDRADNAVMYRNQFDALEVRAMYSADPSSDNVTGGLDNNDRDLISVSLTYNMNQLTVGAALEQWSLDPVSNAEEVDNLRLMAIYTLEGLQLGAIYESTDSDDPVFERDAYGVNAKYKLDGSLDIRAQYLIADDHGGQTDSGAQHLALGVFNQLDEATQIYAAYTLTDNDANASYQGIDGGHGDELTTAAGGSPSAISIGAVYKF